MITLNRVDRSDTVSIIKFLSSYNHPLIIPNNFQRDYVWSMRPTKTSPSALNIWLNDFINLVRASRKNINYKFVFGNDVCVASNGNKTINRVADGQQRLTTIFIFGIYLANKSSNVKQNLSQFYVSDYELKLQHSTKCWDDLFKSTITNNFSEDDEIILPIKEAIDQIDDFVNDHEGEFNADEWINVLFNSVYINTHEIALDDEESYFVDVNSKGVTLNYADMCKRSIIKSCCCDLEKATELWQNMMISLNKLSNECAADIKTILRWALYVEDLIQDTTYIKNIESNIPENKGIDIIKTMKAICDVGLTTYNNDKFIPLRHITRQGSYIPFIYKMIYKYKLSPKEAILRMCYLYITKGTSVGASKSFAKDITLYSGKFDLDFDFNINLTYDGKDASKERIKLMLYILEYKLIGNLSAFHNYELGTLEHICSQSKAIDNIHSLGNLTLLSKKENSKLNKIQDKYNIYRGSMFNITKAMCDDWHNSDDEIRIFRNKYFKSMNSQDLDNYNNFIDREQKLKEAFYEVISECCK